MGWHVRSPLKILKRVVLRTAKTIGVLRMVADSDWRRDRLLILAFHGISLDEEHEWRRELFFTRAEFDRRIRLLQRWRLNVLPLAEAVDRLEAGTLPSRSAALTFDDGHAGFGQLVWPRLKQAGYPATVYPTTYYSEKRVPVFPLACSYVLWKGRKRRLPAAPELGVPESVDLSQESVREEVAAHVITRAAAEGLDATARQERLIALAELAGVDHERMLRHRVLQIMTPEELQEVARDGADIQLHTHRHRSPDSRLEFRREVLENRERIEAITGKSAVHLCYPSGRHRPEYFPWLEELEVITATTCVPSLATRASSRLALPRVVDTSYLGEIELEGWLSGVSQFLWQRPVRGEPSPMPTSLVVAR